MMESLPGVDMPDWFNTLDGGIKPDPRVKPGHPDTRLQYMSKGADGFTCRRYGGHRKRGGQGLIPFKRSGVSQNLNRKARAAYESEMAAAMLASEVKTVRKNP